MARCRFLPLYSIGRLNYGQKATLAAQGSVTAVATTVPPGLPNKTCNAPLVATKDAQTSMLQHSKAADTADDIALGAKGKDNAQDVAQDVAPPLTPMKKHCAQVALRADVKKDQQTFGPKGKIRTRPTTTADTGATGGKNMAGGKNAAPAFARPSQQSQRKQSRYRRSSDSSSSTLSGSRDSMRAPANTAGYAASTAAVFGALPSTLVFPLMMAVPDNTELWGAQFNGGPVCCGGAASAAAAALAALRHGMVLHLPVALAAELHKLAAWEGEHMLCAVLMGRAQQALALHQAQLLPWAPVDMPRLSAALQQARAQSFVPAAAMAQQVLACA